jgi:hypothetical protein
MTNDKGLTVTEHPLIQFQPDSPQGLTQKELGDTNLHSKGKYSPVGAAASKRPCERIDRLPGQGQAAAPTGEYLYEYLGISFSGAKSQVQRARERLKQQLLE